VCKHEQAALGRRHYDSTMIQDSPNPADTPDNIEQRGLPLNELLSEVLKRKIEIVELLN
jgi:hypothetical protein